MSKSRIIAMSPDAYYQVLQNEVNERRYQQELQDQRDMIDYATNALKESLDRLYSDENIEIMAQASYQDYLYKKKKRKLELENLKLQAKLYKKLLGEEIDEDEDDEEYDEDYYDDEDYDDEDEDDDSVHD